MVNLKQVNRVELNRETDFTKPEEEKQKIKGVCEMSHDIIKRRSKKRADNISIEKKCVLMVDRNVYIKTTQHTVFEKKKRIKENCRQCQPQTETPTFTTTKKRNACSFARAMTHRIVAYR